MLINIPLSLDDNSQEILALSDRLVEQDRVIILSGTTWEDFEYFISEEYLGYRVSYQNGEITIVSPGRNHERIVQVINSLIIFYCLKFDKLYFPFGSTTLKNPPLVGKEPDVSFAFDQDKDIPDLAVEVIFSSGSILDLEKYRILGVKEVWLWKNEELIFYLLTNNTYHAIPQSYCLSNLFSADLVTFINRGFTESPITIKTDFIKQFD